MSKLNFDFGILEVRDTDGIPYVWGTDLPHHKEIKEFIEDVWKNYQMIDKITDEALYYDKIDSIKLNVRRNTNTHQTVCRITAEFKPGFRVTEKYRDAFYDYIEDQIDGYFGECIHNQAIPGAGEGYYMEICSVIRS